MSLFKSAVSILFVVFHLSVIGQCSTVSVQISSSDTTFVQLYNAGFFNLPSGFANVVEWEVRDFSGELVYQEITSGDFEEQSRIQFEHTVPITDSMKATIVITNEVEGFICTMNDTLYWEVTEVLPGSFVGNWGVLSGNGGVEMDITTNTEQLQELTTLDLVPTVISSHFTIVGDLDRYVLRIDDSTGRTVVTNHTVQNGEQVHVAELRSGIYFVTVYDVQLSLLSTIRVVKL